MVRVEDGGRRRDRRQVVGGLDVSHPMKLVSPERQEAACDADRQAHVGWRKIHVRYTGQGSYLGTLHPHVRAECEVGGKTSGVAEVDVKDCI
jgi:hypothetical protein